MALKLENINNLIADDLAKRNENWTEIDDTFALKADKATTYTKAEVDTSLELKANKQQEAWITPTLLNGATGTIQYRKNQFGRLEFRGDLIVVAKDIYQFVLPVAYRPFGTTWFSKPNTNGGVTAFKFDYVGNFTPYNITGTFNFNDLSFITT